MNHVPRLEVSREIESPDPELHLFRYRARNHQDLPQVVKFSGGRSSGMMLFTMLENRLLHQERGDLVLFNNTSAEHPATYRFIAECKRRTEQAHIPFFIIEYTTYEDARRGEWQRIPSYRMVNEMPASPDNPQGFHQNGEVFEEMLSQRMFVPNKFSRVCTQSLKLETTRDFMWDWTRGRATIPLQGHGEKKSRIDPERLHLLHARNKGQTPREIFLEKKQYVLGRPTTRPQQSYGDFSAPAAAPRPAGPGPEYISMIGLRSDEQLRVYRVSNRESNPQTNAGYEREHPYMPLADMGITRDDVNRFWKNQDWDLELPENGPLSNCVYCFLKGSRNLTEVHRLMQQPDSGSIPGTPSDLGWWQDMERRYGRDNEKEGREIRNPETGNFIGFFGGSTNFSYEILDRQAGPEAQNPPHPQEVNILPCDCTE